MIFVGKHRRDDDNVIEVVVTTAASTRQANSTFSLAVDGCMIEFAQVAEFNTIAEIVANSPHPVAFVTTSFEIIEIGTVRNAIP